MIEIRCDRCGGILRDKYFTIHINEEYLNHNPQTATLIADSITSAYNYPSQQEVLRLLTSQPMYCESCKDEINEFIKHKP